MFDIMGSLLFSELPYFNWVPSHMMVSELSVPPPLLPKISIAFILLIFHKLLKNKLFFQA